MSVITAFVLINAEAQRVADLGAEIAELDSVHEVHSVAGSGVALVATLRVQRHEDIAVAVTEDISRINGVIDTQTLIAFRSYSTKDQQVW